MVAAARAGEALGGTLELAGEAAVVALVYGSVRWFSAINGSFQITLITPNDWENPTEIVQKHTFILESGTLDVLHIPSGFLSHIKALQDNAQLLVLADYKLKEIADEYKFPLETFNL